MTEKVVTDLPVPLSAHTPFSAARWSVVSFIVTYAVVALLYIPLARLLNPDDFGLYTEATLVYSGIFQVVELSLIRAIIRTPGDRNAVAQAGLWLSAAIGVVGMILCAVAGLPLAVIYNNSRLPFLLLLLAPSVLATALGSVPQAILSRELDFRRKLIPEATSVCVGAAIGLLAAWRGAGVYSLIIYTVSRVIINTIVAWLVVRWRPTRSLPDRTVISALLGFILPTGAGELGLYARLNVDYTIAGLQLGTTGLGVYSLAWETSYKPAQFINATFKDVGYAAFARLGAGDALRRLYISATRLIAGIALPLLLCGILVRQDVVSVVFGAKWQSMVDPLAPLFLLQLFWLVFYPCTSVILALGRGRLYAWINNVGLLVTIAAVLVGVQSGVVGVAWAMFVAVGTLSLVWGIYSWLLLGVDLPALWTMSKVPLLFGVICVLAVALVQALCVTLHMPTLPRLAIFVLVAVVAFAGCTRVCWPTLRRDLALLRQKLPTSI